MTYRVAELITESLAMHGVDRGFCVPGESFLALLDALHDSAAFDLVTCRHEGSASMAAVADAKLTGRPGVVLASRGPGAFNAAIGVHVAAEEAVPLVLLIGQVDTPNLGRNAVQEIDSTRAFSGLLKWSGRIDRASQAAEVMARAFAAAASGTPGPVAVELPEDVLTLPAQGRPRVHGVARACASASDIADVHGMLATAQRPLMIVGGQCRSDRFRSDLHRLAQLWKLPLAVTNKNQDQFANDHALWVGQLGFFTAPAHQALFAEADLILAIGSRMGDVSSLGFNHPRQGEGRQKLIQVYPDAAMIGRHFQVDLGIVSGAAEFVHQTLEHGQSYEAPAPWRDRARMAADAAHGWSSRQIASADVMGHAIDAIAQQAAPDAVLTTDSGNFASWVHRIFKLGPSNRLLGSACGAMGAGVPAGVAAALRFPGRQVLAFCGDGGFLMNGNELATAVARKLDLKIIVSNNSSYGTIRSHQQRHFPGRVSGTDLVNPDFSKLADAFGAKGFRIQGPADAPGVVTAAMRTPGPVLIEIVNDVDVGIDASLRRPVQD